MARIISYPYDTDITDKDAWVGSDAATTRTKQYTAEAVAKYLNINGKISIGAQMVFKYVQQPLTGQGYFSITTGGVNNIPFASITTLTLSVADMGDQNTVAFLDYLVGSDILIGEQNEISIFGHYDVISYAVNPGNAGYYDMVVNHKGSNGSLSFDKYYDVMNFILAADASDKTFIFNQGVPAAQWVISHNLGKFPSVSVVNNNKVLINGEVEYIDNNNLTVTFSAGFAGQAYLN
tara:strand:+ start:1062 stop:1766 length:705 start_codon:yes stop_codon:yes gene_type:complete